MAIGPLSQKCNTLKGKGCKSYSLSWTHSVALSVAFALFIIILALPTYKRTFDSVKCIRLDTLTMGQVTVRVDDKDLSEMDRLLKAEGLETRSELIRKAWKLFKTVKSEEAQGRVLMMMPSEQVKNSPIQLSF